MPELLTYDNTEDEWTVSIAADRSEGTLTSFEYVSRFTDREPDPESIAVAHATGTVCQTGSREGIPEGANVTIRVALDTPHQVHRATVATLPRFCDDIDGVEVHFDSITIEGVEIGDFEPTRIEAKGDAEERATIAIKAANAGVDDGPGAFPSVRNALYHYAKLANWGTSRSHEPAPLRVLVASLCDDSLSKGEYTDASFDSTYAAFVPEWDFLSTVEIESDNELPRNNGIPEQAGCDWNEMEQVALSGDLFTMNLDEPFSLDGL